MKYIIYTFILLIITSVIYSYINIKESMSSSVIGKNSSNKDFDITINNYPNMNLFRDKYIYYYKKLTVEQKKRFDQLMREEQAKIEKKKRYFDSIKKQLNNKISELQTSLENTTDQAERDRLQHETNLAEKELAFQQEKEEIELNNLQIQKNLEATLRNEFNIEIGEKEAEIKKNEENIKNLEDNKSKLEKTVEEKTTTNTNLRSDLSDYKVLAQNRLNEIDEITKNCALEKEKYIKEQTDRYNKLKKQSEESEAEIRNRLEFQYKNMITEWTNKYNGLETECNNKYKSMSSEFGDKYNRLNTEYKNYETQSKNRLNQVKQEHDNKYNTLVRQKQNLDNQHNNLVTQCRKQEQDYNRVQREKQALSNEKTTLNNEKNSLNSQLQNLRRQYNDLNTKFDEKSKERDNWYSAYVNKPCNPVTQYVDRWRTHYVHYCPRSRRSRWWSDETLKYDIKHIGFSPCGISVYTFKYNDIIPDLKQNTTYQGVIAQELLDTDFKYAVQLEDNGFYSVDYDKLDVKFKEV